MPLLWIIEVSKVIHLSTYPNLGLEFLYALVPGNPQQS